MLFIHHARPTIITLPDVLDLTRAPLPLETVDEELFPDFSVLGSFNFSAPSASLFLTRDANFHFVQLKTLFLAHPGRIFQSYEILLH